ncbi:MAG: acyl-CoA dehydrogenase [Candidatus Kapaibacterium sp.]|nr:MAG: acyl-CoA dehydrogenase [Candidatus Kapabacteria bacterium]
MNIFHTDRITSILPQVRSFVAEEIIPLEHDYLHGTFRALEPRLHALRSKVKEKGLWTPHLPEADGGLGLTLTEFGILSEELGRSPLGHYVFNCQAPDIGNMELLHQFATEAQKHTFLEPLMRGEIRSCFAMTEPEFAGSNPVNMATTAVREGDEYIVNGHKWFTSSADGASFLVVMAVTNPEAAPHKRASMLIMPATTDGYTLVRNIKIMGDEGDSYASHAEVRFENCRIPAANLLGSEGAGFALAQHRLGPGRIHHCMRFIGIAERALELMCRYAISRQLAHGKPLASRQSIQMWIAESRAEIDAARYMVLHTADGIDKQGAKAMKESISTIKFFVANMLQHVLDRAVQVHGALGVTDDTVLAYWYRHERAARIYDGPDEVHKTVLARTILKTYGYEIEQ